MTWNFKVSESAADREMVKFAEKYEQGQDLEQVQEIATQAAELHFSNPENQPAVVQALADSDVEGFFAKMKGVFEDAKSKAGTHLDKYYKKYPNAREVIDRFFKITFFQQLLTDASKKIEKMELEDLPKWIQEGMGAAVGKPTAPAMPKPGLAPVPASKQPCDGCDFPNRGSLWLMAAEGSTELKADDLPEGTLVKDLTPEQRGNLSKLLIKALPEDMWYAISGTDYAVELDTDNTKLDTATCVLYVIYSRTFYAPSDKQSDLHVSGSESIDMSEMTVAEAIEAAKNFDVGLTETWK